MSPSKAVQQLLAKREVEMDCLVRFAAFLDSYKIEQRHQLDVRCTIIEQSLNEFKSIQLELDLLNSNETICEQYYAEREKFEKLYYESLGKARECLNINNIESKEFVTKVQSNFDPTIRLPTISLPTFSGAYSEWNQFKDSFVALVHNNASLSNIQKFHYLKLSLKHDAAKVIHSLEASDANYDIAWEILTQRFENKRLTIDNHLRAIFEIPSITRENVQQLRHMSDTLAMNLRCLKTLKLPIEHWDTIIVFIITGKFDTTTKREWETLNFESELPNIAELKTFLNKRCSILEAIQPQSLNNSNRVVDSNKKNIKTVSYTVTSERKCGICDENHALYQCNAYKTQSVATRLATVQQLKLCFNCLQHGHRMQFCKSKGCFKCGKRHHTSLHKPSVEGESVPGEACDVTSSAQTMQTSVALTNQTVTKTAQVLLSTAVVNILGIDNQVHKCRILLDCGSQSNFITKSMCELLQLKTNAINQVVNGINSCESQIKHSVDVTVKSRHNNYSTHINCLVLPKITENLPVNSFDIGDWGIPNYVKLADTEFNKSAPINMLIGAQVFWQLLCVGKISLGNNKPTLHKTHFGWILTGAIYTANRSLKTHSFCAISDALTKFWALEECGDEQKLLSEDEQLCENIFMSTATRNDEGRFVVTIPFKQPVAELGQSRDQALKRFFNLEKRLANDAELKKEYTNFMSEYETLGHMSEIEELQSTAVNYYLPHHCVRKDSSLSTKYRVVFDGSASTDSGKSLNDIQYVGPVTQTDLISILLRFRKHRFVISADIEKMYRQILIDEQQRELQRILWRADNAQPVKCYCLNTVTYGLTSSPYLATRCLKQLAIENKDKLPAASASIEYDFYMDDLLTGANTVHEAKALKDDISVILEGAHCNLRKWLSNHSDIIKDIEDENDSLKVISSNDSSTNKTLGIFWNASADTLQYSVKDFSSCTNITKRVILSTISQIFDPCGNLSPLIIVAKLIMQELWKTQADWDDPVDNETRRKWLVFQSNLYFVNKIRIPRFILINDAVEIHLHGFCDASEKAYGACIYLKSTNTTGESTVRLLCAKSKVAPLKYTSLPRLELCGALLLARLYRQVVEAIKLQIHMNYFWCDSTIVLCWLRAESSRWKTFVANRVAKIQTLTVVNDWHHVTTDNNAADIITRGTNAEQFLSLQNWWNGPTFLYENIDLTQNHFEECPMEELPEVKGASIALVVTENKFDIFEKYSSLDKLIRIVAYCLRFGHNLKKDHTERETGLLTLRETEDAFLRLVNCAQRQSLSTEMRELTKNNAVKNKNRLSSLNPFLDERGTMRVGGRLQHSELGYEAKHQIILPQGHSFTLLIANDRHMKELHLGPQALLAKLRESFWPISGRNLVRQVVHKCITCFRAKPRFQMPQMGELPKSRVTPTFPFHHSSLDYAGPFMIKDKRTRGCKAIKAYVCVFVCCATKGVHLELVGNLTSESFIAALRRFVARRGAPRCLYSDNATNFVGAKNELNDLFVFLKEEREKPKFREFLLGNHMEWRFIPARSPHFGGLHEAAVKSMKYHLKRVAGIALLKCKLNVSIN